MRSIVHNIKAVLGKASAQVTGSGTGLIVDTKGFHSLAVLVSLGAVAAADAENTLAFSVQEGDSALGYDMVDVAASRLILPLTLSDVAVAQSIQKFGVILELKRYIRVKYVETGTVDATFDVMFILGNPEDMPVA